MLDFNRAATEAGSHLLARSVPGTGPWDLEIFNPLDGTVVEHIQAKSYAEVGAAIRAFAHEKYRGMTLLAPSDQVEPLKGTLDARSHADPRPADRTTSRRTSRDVSVTVRFQHAGRNACGN